MRKTGFTLIELMLVVIIIGILIAMVAPRMTGRSEEARIKIAQADVKTNIPMALKLYELDNGRFPDGSAGLNSLMEQPASALNWKGPYIEYEPLDPWGTKYNYIYPARQRKYDYDLWSSGPDAKSGTEDDITNWSGADK